MENRAHAIVALCFLVVFTIGAALIFFWLTAGPGEPRLYRIVTRQSVGGLAPQSLVEFKGLPVGHVKKVRFDPEDRARVIIDFRVRQDTYVSHATYAVVALKGLTGGKVLQLKLGDGSRAPLATRADNPAHIPLRPGLIAKLKDSALENLEQLHALLTEAKAVLDQDNRRHLAATIRQLDTLSAQLVAMQDNLAPTIQQLPQLLHGLQQTLEQTQTLLANANEVVKQARGPVKQAGELADTLQQLGHKLNRQTLPDVHALAQSLTRTSRLLEELVRELKAKPQSLIFGPPQPRPGPGEPGFQARGDPGDGHGS